MSRRWIASTVFEDRSGTEPVHDGIASEIEFAKPEEAKECAPGHGLRQRLDRGCVVGHAGGLKLLVREQGVRLSGGIEDGDAVEGDAAGEALRHEPKREPDLLLGVGDGDDLRSDRPVRRFHAVCRTERLFQRRHKLSGRRVGALIPGLSD